MAHTRNLIPDQISIPNVLPIKTSTSSAEQSYAYTATFFDNLSTNVSSLEAGEAKGLEMTKVDLDN